MGSSARRNDAGHRRLGSGLRSEDEPPSRVRQRLATLLRRFAHPVLFLIIVLAAIPLMISPRIAERFLFFPSRLDPGPPPRVAGVDGEDVTLVTADGLRIHAWWFEAGRDSPAVLFLHGNAGTIADRLFQADGLVREGVSVLLLSYRGYGRSEGRPTEAGVTHDAEAGLDWLIGRVGSTDRIVIHGRSLGGAVAGLLVARRSEPAGLILESTFTDLAGIAASVYPFLPRLLLRRLEGHYDTRAAISTARLPVLVIHGAGDELIPASMGRELARAAGGRARLLEIAGAGHNDLPFVAGSDYFEGVAAFVREVTAGGPAAETW